MQAVLAARLHGEAQVVNQTQKHAKPVTGCSKLHSVPHQLMVAVAACEHAWWCLSYT